MSINLSNVNKMDNNTYYKIIKNLLYPIAFNYIKYNKIKRYCSTRMNSNPSTFMLALSIATTFLIGKFLEMRFIEKESKPLKLLLKDTLLVYGSVFAAGFVIDQLKPLVSKGSIATPIFTDNPGF